MDRTAAAISVCFTVDVDKVDDVVRVTELMTRLQVGLALDGYHATVETEPLYDDEEATETA